MATTIWRRVLDGSRRTTSSTSRASWARAKCAQGSQPPPLTFVATSWQHPYRPMCPMRPESGRYRRFGRHWAYLHFLYKVEGLVLCIEGGGSSPLGRMENACRLPGNRAHRRAGSPQYARARVRGIPATACACASHQPGRAELQQLDSNPLMGRCGWPIQSPRTHSPRHGGAGDRGHTASQRPRRLEPGCTQLSIVSRRCSLPTGSAEAGAGHRASRRASRSSQGAANAAVPHRWRSRRGKSAATACQFHSVEAPSRVFGGA